VNGETVSGVRYATREDARAAVEAAAKAFPRWSATPAAERRTLLERGSELLMERQPDIAALVTEETGGTLGWGMFNVEGAFQ
jgi:acyl-CoA reductase-like NAD-dependent aldehyde dehydrogenase